MENYKHKQQKTTVFPRTFIEPKDENIDTFLKTLSKLSSKAVVLHSYSEHWTSFIPIYKSPEWAKFQNSLWDLCSKDNLNLNENELILIVNKKFENLKLPMIDIDYVERFTKKRIS